MKCWTRSKRPICPERAIWPPGTSNTFSAVGARNSTHENSNRYSERRTSMGHISITKILSKSSAHQYPIIKIDSPNWSESFAMKSCQSWLIFVPEFYCIPNCISKLNCGVDLMKKIGGKISRHSNRVCGGKCSRNSQQSYGEKKSWVIILLAKHIRFIFHCSFHCFYSWLSPQIVVTIQESKMSTEVSVQPRLVGESNPICVERSSTDQTVTIRHDRATGTGRNSTTSPSILGKDSTVDGECT